MPCKLDAKLLNENLEVIDNVSSPFSKTTWPDLKFSLQIRYSA